MPGETNQQRMRIQMNRVLNNLTIAIATFLTTVAIVGCGARHQLLENEVETTASTKLSSPDGTCSDSKCFFYVSITNSCSKGGDKDIKVKPHFHAINRQANEGRLMIWKIETAGYKFASDGIKIKDDPSGIFTVVRSTPANPFPDSEYRMTNRTKQGQDYNADEDFAYAVNLLAAPSGGACQSDPFIRNQN